MISMDPDRPRRILVIEDEATTASTIALYLRHEGMEPSIATDGMAGLELARSGRFDLIVLDLMLPGLDGMEICREIRKTSDVPVIMVTARTTENDRIAGLDRGADDYMSKPFSPRELVARIRANLRRTGELARDGSSPIVHGSLRIDRSSREVSISGRNIALTHLEFELLTKLASSPGRLWTREMLIEALFDDPDGRDDRTIDAHIKNLRRKIEPDRRRPVWIRTVFGSGYRFHVPVENGA